MADAWAIHLRLSPLWGPPEMPFKMGSLNEKRPVTFQVPRTVLIFVKTVDDQYSNAIMSIWNALILSARNLVSKVKNYCQRFKACLVRTGFASKSMAGIRLIVFALFAFAALLQINH